MDPLEVAGDAIVLFTSGSTGRPKAALQSMHRFLGKFAKPGKSFRTLPFLLFDHVAGLDTLLYTLSNGGAVVVTRDRSPSGISRLIDDAMVEVRHRPSCACSAWRATTASATCRA